MVTNERQGQAIYPDRRNLLLRAAILLSFIAGLLWFAFAAHREGSNLLGLLFFVVLALAPGYAGLTFARRALSHKPTLILTAEGMWCNVPEYGDPFLRWGDIEAIAPYEAHRHRFLAIYLRDSNVVWSRLGAKKSKVLKTLNRGSAAPIRIPQAMVSLPLEELIALLRDRYGVAVGAPSPLGWS